MDKTAYAQTFLEKYFEQIGYLFRLLEKNPALQGAQLAKVVNTSYPELEDEIREGIVDFVINNRNNPDIKSQIFTPNTPSGKTKINAPALSGLVDDFGQKILNILVSKASAQQDIHINEATESFLELQEAVNRLTTLNKKNILLEL